MCFPLSVLLMGTGQCQDSAILSRLALSSFTTWAFATQSAVLLTCSFPTSICWSYHQGHSLVFHFLQSNTFSLLSFNPCQSSQIFILFHQKLKLDNVVEFKTTKTHDLPDRSWDVALLWNAAALLLLRLLSPPLLHFKQASSRICIIENLNFRSLQRSDSLEWLHSFERLIARQNDLDKLYNKKIFIFSIWTIFRMILTIYAIVFLHVLHLNKIQTRCESQNN